MKKFLSICLVLITMFSVFSITASAEAVVGIGEYDAEIDGLYYCFYEDESIAEAYVVGYEIDADNIAPAGAITIPEVVTYKGDKYTVTGIESEAFYMSLFTSVTLPSSINYIGDYAFSTCDYLENVVIPDDCKFDYFGLNVFITTPFEAVIYSKDETIFGQNVLFSYVGNADEYVVPANIDIIANCCFFMSGVKNVVLNDKIEEISEYAFASCRNIKSIVIPDNVTEIDVGAFRDCTSLENVTLGKGVQKICVEAFSNTKIKSIHLGQDVYSIAGAFKDCTTLESITIDPANTAFITNGKAVYSKTKFKVDGKDKDGLILQYYLPSKAQGKITLPSNVGAIGEYAFYGCNDIEEVSANNLMFVDSFAFCNSAIKKFTASGNYRIENGAFRNCKNLETMDLENVEYIGVSAFENCTSLKNVTLPENIEMVNECAFANTGITEITIYGDDCDICESAFKNCENLKTVNIEDGVTYVGMNAFLGCSEIETIYISKSVLLFDDNAFNGCEDARFQVVEGSRAHDFVEEKGYDFETVGRVSFFERIRNFFVGIFETLFGWILG